MVTCRFSPAALRDLEAIYDYTVTHWGLTQAERYTRAIARSCERLAQAPEIGVDCSELRTGYRRHSVQRHSIYYQQRDGVIIVVRILHQRMDPALHLP